VLIALQKIIQANLTKFAYGIFVFTQVTNPRLKFPLDRRVSFGLFFGLLRRINVIYNKDFGIIPSHHASFLTRVTGI